MGAADDWAAVGAKATVARRGGHEHPGHGASCRACGGLHRRTPVDGWTLAGWIAVGIAVAVGLVLRFWTQSHLWLDEALSVNIARLPVGDIPEALRHDGHPPLYYWLLHGWMSVFGEGDAAVRALSGVCAVAALPLIWFAGKRLGGRTVGVARRRAARPEPVGAALRDRGADVLADRRAWRWRPTCS